MKRLLWICEICQIAEYEETRKCRYCLNKTNVIETDGPDIIDFLIESMK